MMLMKAQMVGKDRKMKEQSNLIMELRKESSAKEEGMSIDNIALLDQRKYYYVPELNWSEPSPKTHIFSIFSFITLSFVPLLLMLITF